MLYLFGLAPSLGLAPPLRLQILISAPPQISARSRISAPSTFFVIKKLLTSHFQIRLQCLLSSVPLKNQSCSAGLQRLKVMANTIDDEREDPFVSLSDSDAEQEAINKLDSDDENDEIIDI